MVNDDDFTIVATYGAEYRGLAEYYLLAGDVWRLNRLRWVAETSMLKTLASKHDSTVAKMAGRYRATIATPYGPRRCFQVSVERSGRNPLVARFGGIPLRRKRARSSPTVCRHQSPSAARSWLPGSKRGDVNCVSTPARWMSIRSASLPTCIDRDARSPHGISSWPKDAGKR
jgi:Type II intron maturase